MSDLRVTNLRGRTAGSAPTLPDGVVITGIATATTFVGQLTGTAGTITTLNSTSGTITNLTGTAGTITTLNSTSGTITNLTGTAGTITTFNSTTITGTSVRGAITVGTAVSSTSGTSIDFTSIPSYVKRITVMFYGGVSTNGTSNIQVQVGAGSIVTTGYLSSTLVPVIGSATGGAAVTTGFMIYQDNAPDVRNGAMVLTSAGSNTWVSSGSFAITNRVIGSFSAGSIVLGGTLDRLRITTVNGTDTFDAGSINILYEG